MKKRTETMYNHSYSKVSVIVDFPEKGDVVTIA